MLDPLLSLALALHNTKGAYAVLCGSGLSRAAGIPTGWEVTLDLTRTLAHLEEGEHAAAAVDPEAWYRTRFGQEPTYSRVLEQVAPTASERQTLLRKYFEPTPEEREERLKLPTRAHHAIARLVRDGVVRVVVTTNFDHLLETALSEAGVAPTVISSADDARGMVPLHLAPATVVKLHGDYLDTRIKNTPDELAAYDPEIDRLLDRIFDEYGLVVCGWSATWDAALRSAILRAPNRRFTTFWATHGEPTPEARLLIDRRRAAVIEIESADAFFDAVAERVASLESLARPHPLSTAVAVATLKRYLPVPEQRIRLADLVDGEVTRVIEHTVPMIAAENKPGSIADTFRIVPRLEAASETIVALMATGAFWGEATHRPVWVRAIARLGNMGAAAVRGAGVHYAIAERLFRYPAQLAFYAAGLGALARGPAGEETLADVLLEPKLRLEIDDGPSSPTWSLNASSVIASDDTKFLPEARGESPMSNRVVEILRPAVQPLVPDAATFDDLFDRFEYLLALLYGERQITRKGYGFWAPVGRLGWRRRRPYGTPTLLDDMAAEIRAAGEGWFLLRRGAFGGSAERLASVKAEVDAVIARGPWD